MMNENNSNRMEISHDGSSLNQGSTESRNKTESKAWIDEKDPVEAKKNDSKSQHSLQSKLANLKLSGSESQLHTQLPQERQPPPSLSCMMVSLIPPGEYHRFDAAEPRRADDQEADAIVFKSLKTQMIKQLDKNRAILKIEELLEKTEKLKLEAEQFLREIEGDEPQLGPEKVAEWKALEDGIAKQESKKDENEGLRASTDVWIG